MLWADLAGRSRAWKVARRTVRLPQWEDLQSFADFPELAPDAALEYWLEREPFLRTDNRLADAVNIYERRSFTIADVYRQDLVESIRETVLDVLQEGLSGKGFVARVREFMRDALSPARLRTVFRTNTQTAYYAGLGREMQDNPVMADEFPWFQYWNPDDSRSRETHEQMSGVWAPRDHEVWTRWWPPNGYNCRCQVRPVSRAEGSRRGLDKKFPVIPNVDPDSGFSGNAAIEIYRGQR